MSTTGRRGTAWNVVRMVPNRYSLVTASTAMIINTNTPNELRPMRAVHAASPGVDASGPLVVAPVTKANPMVSTATIATHQ